MSGGGSSAVLRRAAALGVDLVVPGVVSAAGYGLLWLWWRPDRAEGMESLGVALTMMMISVVLWVVAFVTNEIVIASARNATLGDRICDLALELPDAPGHRRLRLAARATLRFTLLVVVLGVFGLSTEYVGEGAGGVVVGALVTVTVVIGVCGLGAQGPTSIIERASRVRVVVRTR